jgi:hypothetical protein
MQEVVTRYVVAARFRLRPGMRDNVEGYVWAFAQGVTRDAIRERARDAMWHAWSGGAPDGNGSEDTDDDD